jgi:hypothetical protein
MVVKKCIKILILFLGIPIFAYSSDWSTNMNNLGMFLKMETRIGDVRAEKFGLFGQLTGGKWFTDYFNVYMGIQQCIRSSSDESFTGVLIGSDLTLFEYEQIALNVNIESQIDFDKDFYISPGIELDYRLEPLNILKVHFCVDEVFQKRDTSWSEDDTETTVLESNAKKVFYPQTEVKIGYTIQVLPGHIFMFTINPLVRNRPLQDEKIVNFNCMAFGYKFNLNNHFQITSELNIGIPQEMKKTNYGIKFLVSTF